MNAFQEWAKHQTLMSDIANRPRPEWLIDEVLPQGSIVFVTGREATAKSFLVQSWAATIATGQAWMNRDVKQGGVIYLALEGNAVFIVERFEAWSKHHGQVIDDTLIPIFETFNVGNKSQQENFLTGVQSGVALVIIDTLAVFAGGANLSSQSEVNFIQEFAQAIIRESRGLASVVIVAHSTKADDSGMSGSIQLNAMADMTWRMEKSVTTYKANLLKSKNGSEREQLVFKLLNVDLSDTASAGVLVASADLEQTSGWNHSKVLAAIPKDGSWINSSAVRTVVESEGLKKTAFYKTINTLSDAGTIEIDKNPRGDKYRLASVFASASVHTDKADNEQRDSLERPFAPLPFRGGWTNSETPQTLIDDQETF